MGTMYKFRCPICGQEFEWHEGPGMLMDVLHCDKCGKEMWTKEPLMEFEHIQCACGGTFDKEVPFICPKCGRELENPRDCVLEVRFWD